MNRASAWIAIGVVASPIALLPVPTLAQGATPVPARESAIKPEKNPPGDIPDNQVFIDYQSPLGFTIKVPEGWARRQASDGATFSDKYNTIELMVAQRAESIDVSGVKQKEVIDLERTGKAVRISSIKPTSLPSGSAIVVAYGSNSESNPVTNKAIRLENERYFFWKDGKLVTLTLSAPFGADNADQWLLVAKSFRWR
uniref:hypothetical protein n=1 Tax=Bradyrhizobium guangxiense TaxID=1325115 RepID=UPI003703AF10